ncbi:hypothetical protein DMC01_01170 [Campylobacter troglodytis]|nr:hypothetical protein DMC01_01170 [Campylobacter troglodytis]
MRQILCKSCPYFSLLIKISHKDSEFSSWLILKLRLKCFYLTKLTQKVYKFTKKLEFRLKPSIL